MSARRYEERDGRPVVVDVMFDGSESVRWVMVLDSHAALLDATVIDRLLRSREVLEACVAYDDARAAALHPPPRYSSDKGFIRARERAAEVEMRRRDTVVEEVTGLDWIPGLILWEVQS